MLSCCDVLLHVCVWITAGMFVYDKKSRMFWFSTVPCENYQEFNLVGVASFYYGSVFNAFSNFSAVLMFG